ncbi:MAG TPA: non-heme iron oxygenase ferredoxin subunit [Candidatus Obscuribacterales bacterium]
MSDTFVKVATKNDVPEGSVRVFNAAGKNVAVCHVEGEFYAVADLCTHDGGPLGEGELVDHQIECPRHGARFDVKSGKVMCLPAVVPIPTYQLELRGDEIWVAVPVGAHGAR